MSDGNVETDPTPQRKRAASTVAIAGALLAAAIAVIVFVSVNDDDPIKNSSDPRNTTSTTDQQPTKRVLLENREVLGDRLANTPIPPVPSSQPASAGPPDETTQVDYTGKTCHDLVRTDTTTWHWDTNKTTCYALGPSLLNGDKIANAQATEDRGQWGVDVQYKRGAFAVIATQYVNKRIAIVVDGVVISAPVINRGITGDSVRISGSFSETEAKALATALSSNH